MDSQTTDEEFKHNVALAKNIVSAEMFSVSLSERLRKVLRRDEFNVYRALRSIKPFSYLFFFLIMFQNIWVFARSSNHR
jgi:anthranilate synthase component 1